MVEVIDAAVVGITISEPDSGKDPLPALRESSARCFWNKGGTASNRPFAKGDFYS